MFSPRAMRVGRSPIERVSQLLGKDVINLAGGSPDPELIPKEKLREAYCEVVDEHGASAFFYPGAGGLEELVAELEKWCGHLNIGGGEIVVTSGAQHAITLLCGALLSPQDEYAHENPTFVETMNPFAYYGGRGIPIPIDGEGMRTDLLEEALRSGRARPKLVYVVPTAHNPSGVSMGLERRKHLAELAERYGFTIVEDDPYRPISEPKPTIYSLTPENVVYVGSLSKALAPGLRIGFVVTRSHALAEKLKDLEQMDFSTSTVNQLVAAKVLSSGYVQARLEEYRRHYQEKREALLRALGERGLKPLYAPKEGFFCLVEVGEDPEALLLKALRAGVAFVPAAEFFYDGSGKNTIRLSVGPAPKSRIAEGVERLAKAASG